MNQIEQRQYIRRQEEVISSQGDILLNNKARIEYLEDKLDKTAKKASMAVREISLASDICMLASGASGMSVIMGVWDGSVSKTVFYIIFSFLAFKLSRGIRRANWV